MKIEIFLIGLNKFIRKVFVAIFPISMAVVCVQAHATQWHKTFNYNAGQLSLPENTPPGTILSRYFVPIVGICIDEFSDGKPCIFRGITFFDKGENGERVENSIDIPTSVQGISARLLIDGVPVKPFEDGAPPISTSSSYVEVDLVSNTHPLTDGVIESVSSNKSYIYICKNPSRWCGWFKADIGIQIDQIHVKAIKGTCVVKNEFVRLPTIKLSDLDMNETAGEVPFALNVHCSPGFHHLRFSLSPAGSPLTPSSSNGVIPPQSASTASGIGVQILDKGTPLPLGYSFEATKLINIESSKQQDYQYRLTARYIKIGGAISAGFVRAAAEVDISYD